MQRKNSPTEFEKGEGLTNPVTYLNVIKHHISSMSDSAQRQMQVWETSHYNTESHILPKNLENR